MDQKMLFLAMLKLTLITLVILLAVIVALSLVVLGPPKWSDLAPILLAGLTTILAILQAIENLSLLENIIPTLKRFGLGGPLYIPS
jgi:hypothetical protein